MKLVDKTRLVYADLGRNSYKHYDAELYDDDTVICKWGVVGATNPQSKTFPNKGKSFYDSKIRAKERKGYERAKVILENDTNVIASGSLADIALSQIKSSSTEAKDIIKRLADSNIHKITNSTSITLSDGLFQTPLGVVTQDGIDDARNLLDYFFKNVKKNKTNAFHSKIDDYLKIIPRKKGDGLHYEDIFPDKDAVQKESDVLDALENSLSLVASGDGVDDSDKKIESVFDLSFDVASENKVRKRLKDWYKKSRKSMHHYNSVEIQEIYEVDIHQYNQNFNNNLDNVVEVWHGSGQANIMSILKTGLFISPPSTAAIAGKLFANGIYGSETSSKALGYSMGRWGQSSGDSGWLFVCEFAMGNAYYPKTYGISEIPKGYNSCWALPHNTGLYNDELIVYSEDQVRIKYLLELK